jgi:hypothetical protein
MAKRCRQNVAIRVKQNQPVIAHLHEEASWTKKSAVSEFDLWANTSEEKNNQDVRPSFSRRTARCGP